MRFGGDFLCYRDCELLVARTDVTFEATCVSQNIHQAVGAFSSGLPPDLASPLVIALAAEHERCRFNERRIARIDAQFASGVAVRASTIETVHWHAK
jgi:hypothetical protein